MDVASISEKNFSWTVSLSLSLSGIYAVQDNNEKPKKMAEL